VNPGVTIDHARSIHFIGICGTAMASVAAALKERGVAVSGSDEGIYPPMSTFLEERGIAAKPFGEANLLHKPDLVVIGNAISRGNPEAEFALEQKLNYCSLPELLKHRFLHSKRTLVVTGTHGKTTTASLLAWLLEHNGFSPSFLIGGIPNNLDQGARFTESDWFVIEGDDMTPRFSTSAASLSITCPRRSLLTTSSLITPTFLATSPKFKLPFNASSISSRATACCWQTATTPTSDRCSASTTAPCAASAWVVIATNAPAIWPTTKAAPNSGSTTRRFESR